MSKSNAYKKLLRDKYIEGWEYAAHWVDGNLKTAFSIIESWKSNYKKGRRGRNMPIIHRQFVRVKNDLIKLDGNILRITIKPRQ